VVSRITLFPVGATSAADLGGSATGNFPDNELQTVLGHTPFPLAHRGSELRHPFASDGYARMFGLPSEHFAWKPLVEIMDAEGFRKIRPHAKGYCGVSKRIEIVMPLLIQSVDAPMSLQDFGP